MKICVFCGGAGTRMWPLSRHNNPKQFQPLVGKKSLFQLMIQRLRKGFDVEDIYVVTGEEYKSLVRKQFAALPSGNLILEPKMRDTTAAVGFAASFLQNKFPNEVMAAIWGADHLVENEKEFIKALKLAEKLAIQKSIMVKVDVKPTFPSVHLGYVEVGRKIKEVSGFGVYEFIRHVEKPNLKEANDYLASGKYLWNTGYLVWKLSTIMTLYEKHLPSEFRILKRIYEESRDGKGAKSLLREYEKIPKISIDYALFEKLEGKDQVVILADLGWTDIGAWNVLKDELTIGEKGNVVRGNHIGLDTENCLIFGPNKKKLITTIGLKDMIIVDTGDSLLICPASRSQDVKKIVARLIKEKKKSYL